MVRALPSKKTARCYSVFGIRVVVDAGLGTLLVTDRSRGAGQRVTTATGLREGDDVANGVGTGEDGHGAVPAQGRCPREAGRRT